MPPFLYWPIDPRRIEYSRSAFKHGVRAADIEHLASVSLREVDVHHARPSESDWRFSGGRSENIVRATIAKGLLPTGQRLEVGLRRDYRYSVEVCRVFHARYL